MKTEKESKVKKLQDGGDVAPPLGPDAQAPAPEGGGQDQIAGMLEQYAQTKDAEIAVQIADLLLVEMGIAPGEASPSVQEAPVTPPPLSGGSPEGVPVFKKGGKISALDQYFAAKKN